MGSKFNAEVHSREGITYLKLSGVIDEDNDLTGLESRIPGGTLVVNLSDVDRINSCGVRDWVNWLGRIEKNGARPVFVEGSPPIVSQINLVHNFTGNGTVRSFYAPYFCSRCEKEKLLLLEVRNLIANGPPFTAPTCRCDECDGVMEFDDMEESYFAFLSNAKKVTPDPAVDAVMLEFSGATENTGSGGKLRPRPTTGQMAAQAAAQASAPAGPVAALPSIPVMPPSSRPGTGSQSAVSPIPAIAALQAASQRANHTTTPGTPAALAQQQAEQAQSLRPGLREGPRSQLAWIILAVLLLAAVGLLTFVLIGKP